MGLNPGTMKVDILADGTVRIETGDMAGVAHKSADEFIKLIQQLMGGVVEVKKVQGHRHSHVHGHDHGHDHHHEEA